MNLIKEITTIIDEPFIVEDLGSLKKIDKKFMAATLASSKIVKNKTAIEKAKLTGKELESYHKTFAAKALPPKIGRNSTTRLAKIKNVAEFMRVYSEPNTVAILITNGIHQLGIFVKGEKNNNVGLDLQELCNINEKFNELITSDLKNSTKTERSNTGTIRQVEKYGSAVLYKLGFGNSKKVKTKTNVDLKDTTKIATKLFVYYKASSMMMDVEIFEKDQEREDIRKTRFQSHAFRQPTVKDKGEYDNFLKNAKDAFKLRLDKYKSSKAVDVEQATDAIQVIIDEGYLNKIKIGGLTYDFYNDHIRFSGLRGKDKWNSNDESYVVYKVNTETAEYKKRYADFRAKFDEYRQLAKTREPAETTDEEDAEVQKFNPIREFKIFLKLEGGRIVPYKIKGEESYW